MRCILVTALVVGSFPLSVQSEGPRRIEYSPDHHQRVELDNKPMAAEPTARYNGVPYLTTPDWSNSIRRQVGAVAVADLNNDGRNDVVAGCYISSSFPPYTDWENLIYYNTGTELEANPSWVSADEVHTGDIVVGDVNLDTYPDILSVNGGTSFSPIAIYFGGPSGPDTTPDWAATNPQAVWAVAGTLFDFDHDGDLDVFTGNQGLSPNPYRPMYGYRNNAGVLQTTPFWQSAEASIQGGLAFGDLDGDGWEDLAVSKWVNFQTAVYKNVAGVLQTTPVWQSGNTGGDRGVSWSDVDGDNDLDLAVGDSPTVLYTNTAGVLSQTWTSTPPATSNPQDMRFFDVDRDGDDDLAEIQFSSGRVFIYLNSGGALGATPAYSYDDPAVGNAVAFGDINGDHWPDMVVGLSGQPCVRVFYARIPNIIGDMNCDGFVNLLDVDPFVQALLDPAGYAATYPYCTVQRGDLNADAETDSDDVQGFIGVLGV